MEILFLIFMILAIALSSLRITAIYINRIVSISLLCAGVLAALEVLSGSAAGGYGNLFQVTTELNGLCEGLHVFSNLINDVTTIAEYVYNSILPNLTVFCEGIPELPVAASYDNLHITDNFTSAIRLLKGLAGVYAIKCTITGAIYIGSSTNLGKRLKDHFVDSTNIHLRNAMLLYGAAAFVFIVVEFIEILPDMSAAALKTLLLAREQIYLDWLFELPSELRYNFLILAGSSLGYRHSVEAKKAISTANTGSRHTEEAKKAISASMSGENHPNYGKTPSEETKALLSAANLGENNPNY